MGTEPFFIDQVTDQLQAKVVEESARDFDCTILYGKETNIDQIVEAAKRFPMMGDRQLIVVREAQYLDRSIEKLESYALNPHSQTVLVLCYKHKVLDKRKKIVKAIADKGMVLTTKPLYDNQIGGWVAEAAKGFDFRFHPHALALLISFLGNDLGKIHKALEKLTHTLEKGSEITPEHIETYFDYSKDFNSFELQKALGQRNLSQAYRIVQYMAVNASQHPFPLTISVVFNFFQKLFMYHGLARTSDAAKVLGVSPYFVKDYQAAAQKYDMKQTAKVLQLLHEFDLKSKGVGAQNIPLEELMKEMILRIVSV